MCNDTAKVSHGELTRASEPTQEEKEKYWLDQKQNEINYHATEIGRLNEDIKLFKDSRDVRKFMTR